MVMSRLGRSPPGIESGYQPIFSLLLVKRLRDFPCGDHDDGPDALEMAVRLACEMFGQAQQVQEPELIPYEDWAPQELSGFGW